MLLRGFPALFRLFWLGKFPHSTNPAPHLFLLVAGTGQHRPSPAPRCASPHPLQNRVPRVQVLLPLPIHLSPGSAKIAWPGDFSYLCCPGQGLVFHCLCPICPRPASFLRTDFPKSSTKTAPHLSVFCVSAPRAAHLRLAMLHASRKIFLFFVYSTAIFEVGGACLFAEKKEVILPLCAAFSPPTGYSSDSSGNCPKIAATPVLTHRRMALRWEKMASVTP